MLAGQQSDRRAQRAMMEAYVHGNGTPDSDGPGLSHDGASGMDEFVRDRRARIGWRKSLRRSR